MQATNKGLGEWESEVWSWPEICRAILEFIALPTADMMGIKLQLTIFSLSTNLR